MAPAERSYRELLGIRAALLLPSGVAVLSLATGIANISVGVTTGPYADLVPPLVQETAGFTWAIPATTTRCTRSGSNTPAR